jgi:hypothetical protein
MVSLTWRLDARTSTEASEQCREPNLTLVKSFAALALFPSLELWKKLTQIFWVGGFLSGNATPAD